MSITTQQITVFFSLFIAVQITAFPAYDACIIPVRWDNETTVDSLAGSRICGGYLWRHDSALLYDWTGGSILVTPFSGVNESTWEHMKLLFWPLFLFALVQRLFFKEQENYWCVKLAEILLELMLIPVLFYTYNGVFGKSPDWINIAIFYITAALAHLFEWWAFRRNWPPCKYPQLALAAICLIGVLFVVFTFMPPQIPLFDDPVTGTNGMKG